MALCITGIRKLMRLDNSLDIQAYRRNAILGVIIVILGLLGGALFIWILCFLIRNMHRTASQWVFF